MLYDIVVIDALMRYCIGDTITVTKQPTCSTRIGSGDKLAAKKWNDLNQLERFPNGAALLLARFDKFGIRTHKKT